MQQALVLTVLLTAVPAVRFTSKMFENEDEKELSVSTEKEASTRTEAAEFQGYAQSIKASASAVNDPGVVFDAQWFADTCDLTEYDASGFDTSKYKLSEDEQSDNDKWTFKQKCAEQGHNLSSYVLTEFKGSKYTCAKHCWAKAGEHKGTATCCMHFVDEEKCAAFVGWETLEDSSWGSNIFNPLNWFRNQKEARLMYQERSGNGQGMIEAQEAGTASGGQAHVQNLIKEVNHLSIAGILNHLLSFYVCMRWFPDAEFVKLARFELGTTYVDEATGPKTSGVTRDEVIQKYLESAITPLRCTSNVNVQDVEQLDKLIEQYNNPTSAIHELYTSVKKIHEAFSWSFMRWLRFGERQSTRIQRVNTAMMWDSSKPDEDSPFMADLRGRALFSKELPWPMMLRSSNEFEHHTFSSDNLFVLCFGPRVVTFPHKREKGQHVLADVNMAGCNGMWDMSRLKDQMKRIKKLFDPRLCFTAKLRRELQDQFLKTFISMNQEFEQVLAGIYTKRVHELDPTKGTKFNLLLDDDTAFEEVAAEGATKAKRKYERIGGLLAKAHAKWIMCPTKSGVSAEPFGVEDNFYRNPKAYDKWLGESTEENKPECKTLDEATGCVKCVVAVKDEHGCALRLNITLDTLLQSIEEEKYPFLKSAYKATEKRKNKDTGEDEFVTVVRTGVCMVRKQSADKAAPNFLNVQDTDVVTRIEVPNNFFGLTDVSISGVSRHDVARRKQEKRRYDDSGETSPDDAVDPYGTSESADHNDGSSSFAPRYIFTTDIAAESDSNVPAHKVDYFMSCPCSRTNFAPHAHFTIFGSQGMAEYYNFR